MPGSEQLYCSCMPPGMTPVVMTRTDTMPGYNHIELDEVHTPSRYIASAFICFSWEVHCALAVSFGSAFPVAIKVMFSSRLQQEPALAPQ